MRIKSIFIVFICFFMTSSFSLLCQTEPLELLWEQIIPLKLYGISFAKKKPNKKFPYGFYKLENIISLIISLFIFFTGIIIIYQYLF